jgi:hypothetical protein
MSTFESKTVQSLPTRESRAPMTIAESFECLGEPPLIA